MPGIPGLDVPSITETMRETNIPGVSIAYKEGEASPQTEAIGYTDKHHIQAMSRVNRKTSFAAASLSKPVFAYLTLKLIEQGVLSHDGEPSINGLDRPLNDIYPFDEWLREHGQTLREQDQERAHQITARHCLSHSSGLSIDSSPDLRFPPGQEYAYSGFGLMYLQKVLEVVTGRSLEDLAQEHVFSKHMPSSSFLPPQKRRYMQETASRRAGSKERVKPANGANSLHTTGIEYANLMEA
jgi:CubicO group peptidase (beta-lactamase class C family)